MAFGVDTTEALNKINWPDFHNWKVQYPQWAGRYFGGGFTWTSPEFTDAKASTDNELVYILPIRASQASRQQTGGETGLGYGVNDGNDTCARIINALDANQLKVPTSGTVWVYLDVEPGTALTSAFWAGFCNAVHVYKYNSASPFAASIYCQYTSQSGKYLPNPLVQSALGSASSDYPNYYTACASAWSSEPEPCSYCAPATVPDFSVFGVYEQPQPGGNHPVVVKAYQYAQRSGCTVTCGEDPNTWAGGQDLDMDGTDSTDAETYMLDIA